MLVLHLVNVMVTECIVFFCPTENCTVRWENKSMYCIVSVFGLAI